MGERTRVLSIGTPMPFIETDVELLRERYDVKHVEIAYRRDLRTVAKDTVAVSQILRDVLWADVVYLWYANLHARVGVALANRLGKQSIVVLGGFEVAHAPELDYGGLIDPRERRRIRATLENADAVLAVDEGLKRDAVERLGIDASHIQVVPTGYDYRTFAPGNGERDFVLAVAGIDSWNRVRLKGLDTFVRAAESLPDLPFKIIGLSGEALRGLEAIAPSNVELVEWVPREDLVPHYQEASVYCQLSLREGLPNALCEAMLCGCTPVGTDTQGIRTAIGDAGFLVPYGDVEETAEAIQRAHSSDAGTRARSRIKRQFPIERRQRELEEVIDAVVGRETVDPEATL